MALQNMAQLSLPGGQFYDLSRESTLWQHWLAWQNRKRKSVCFNRGTTRHAKVVCLLRWKVEGNLGRENRFVVCYAFDSDSTMHAVLGRFISEVGREVCAELAGI